MKLLIAVAGIVLSASLYSCKSSSADAPKTFCDTVCLKDSLKFTGSHTQKPMVTITAKECLPDSIIWGHAGMPARKTGFTYLLNTTVNINKDIIRTVFRENAAAYILFNDCATGRGFQIILPYDKTATLGLRGSALNNFDPKFSIDNNILANMDRGNIFVEDMTTGKKAMMTLGKAIDVDYNAIHDHVDSVSITKDRIWAKVKIEDKWEELEKKITFE
jgi:hypothetical protein